MDNDLDELKRIRSNMATVIVQQEGELEQARARLADYEDSYRRVMAEECAPDEQHCACVPALRAEIARLEHRAIAAETAHESANDLLVKAEAERDHMKEKARWIPVSERMPEIGVAVQFGDCATGEQVVGKFDRMRNGAPIVEVYHDRNTIYYRSNFTHWKPLDEPPMPEGV